MFEKEAEEWAIDYVCKDCSRYKECKSKEHCTCKECSKEKWQNGAEFGYNKANEWHYMEDELPPKKVPLNIITFDKNKKRRVWVGEYDGGNGQWWTGYFNHFIDVPYAWREIILPEQEGWVYE